MPALSFNLESYLSIAAFMLTPLTLYYFYAWGPLKTPYRRHQLIVLIIAAYLVYFVLVDLVYYSYQYLGEGLLLPGLVSYLVGFLPPIVSLMGGWVLSHRETGAN